MVIFQFVMLVYQRVPGFHGDYERLLCWDYMDNSASQEKTYPVYIKSALVHFGTGEMSSY